MVDGILSSVVPPPPLDYDYSITSMFSRDVYMKATTSLATINPKLKPVSYAATVNGLVLESSSPNKVVMA